MKSYIRSRTVHASVLCAAALAAGLTSMSASAASVRVRVSRDPHVTYLRLQKAATVVCDSAGGAGLVQYQLRNKCYRATLQDALEQVNDPVLLAMHRQRWGKVAG